MSSTAYFFDEDDARVAAEQLRAGGFQATVRRGRFAGEDDDEDQPWVLSADAPDLMVEVAAEEAGGWVEHDADSLESPAPLSLPTEPIRSQDD